jgi:NAD-dependent oxidoreductase involved in siderophore biosynthesis
MSAAPQPEAGPSAPSQGETPGGKKPVVIMCIGMAGSVSLLARHHPVVYPRPSQLTPTGQDDTDAASELAPTLKELSSLYPQPRPCSRAHAI